MVKSNKLFKVLLIVLAIICIVSISGVANAADNPTDTEIQIPTAQYTTLSSKATSWGGIILGVVTAIGMSVAVIILVWLGVKYIMSSPDGKAEIKKQAFAYILGAVLLFGASALVSMFKNIIDTEVTVDTSAELTKIVEEYKA